MDDRTFEDLEQKNRRLAAMLAAAISDITELAKNSDAPCEYCKNYHSCAGEDCAGYVFIAADPAGRERYSCMELRWGTCPMMKDTPCNGCAEDDFSGWCWRGQAD